MDAQNRPELESIVQEIGEAVLTTIATVEHLSQRIDVLAEQVQQQGYQIFALSDAVQALTEAQQASLNRVDRLTNVLERLVTAVDPSDAPPA